MNTTAEPALVAEADLSSAKRRTFALWTVLACCLMYFIERHGADFVATVARICSFGLVVRYLFMLLATKRSVLLTSFYQLYYMLGLLLSAEVISSGAEMTEVGAFGNANGFFWIILIYFIVGMEATCAGFDSSWVSRFGRNTPAQSWSSTKLIILGVCPATIFISGYILLRFGSPWIIGVDRVTFWRFSVPQYLYFVPTLVQQTYFFVAYFYLMSRAKKNELFIPILLIIGYLLITFFVLGQKFSAFILMFDAWLVIVSGAFPLFKIKASTVVYLSVIFALLIFLIVIAYVLSGSNASFIFTRIALQAQLEWSVFSDPYGLHLLPDQRWECYFGCAWLDSGRDYISYQYLPHRLYKFYYDVDSSLSGFMPALPILTFGLILTFVLDIAANFLLGMIQRQIFISIDRDNFVASALLYKIRISLAVAWFSSTLTSFAGAAVTLAVLVLYTIIFGRGARHDEIGRAAT